MPSLGRLKERFRKQSSGKELKNRFVYSPLQAPREEIRVLELLPGTTVKVECNIKHVRLDSNPQYHAVSYTWGPSIEPTTIYLSGKPFNVPRSAYDALLGLRLPIHAGNGTEGFGRNFWIDAICIDQSNDPEKEHQIMAMKDIYSRSQHVLVWMLPRPGEDPLPAIKMLKFDINARVDGGLSVREINALNNFLRHLWFDRTWTFQEVVLPRSFSIIYGCSNGDPRNNEISWELLLSQADTLINKPNSSMFKNFYAPDPVVKATLASILRIEQARTWIDDPASTMERVLFYTRRRKVTNPRDAIYGLLGISQDVQKLNIIPSYKQSIEEVFQDCAIKVIENSHSLLILSAAGLEHHSGSHNLPSWVPDWTTTPTSSLLVQNENNVTTRPRIKHFSWTPAASFPEPGVLALAGLTVTAIASISDPFPNEPTKDLDAGANVVRTNVGVNVVSNPAPTIVPAHISSLLQFLDSAERLVAEAYDPEGCFQSFVWPASYSSPQNWILNMSGNSQVDNTVYDHHTVNCQPLPFIPFLRTLIASRNDEEVDNRADGYGNSDLATSYLTYKHALARSLNIQPSCPLASPSELQNASIYMPTTDTKSFASSLAYACTGRRFARAGKGDLCLVPSGTQVGDLVFLCQGAEVPFVVRRVGAEGEEPRCRIVGECYVEGLMTEEGALERLRELSGGLVMPFKFV